MRVLLTGGCGFIGSHTARQVLTQDNVKRLINLDALTYSGHPDNLADINDERYQFIHGSINDYELVETILEEEEIDLVLHLAAESHVDRAIHSVEPFLATNIDGTRSILEAIVNRQRNGQTVHLVHVSTDEVYGSLGPSDEPFTETTPLDPRNPYAATKAAADLLVRSFTNTYGISAVITRCSNNYGPNQFPEKLIPLMTLNAFEGKQLPIYGDGMQIRDWIHVLDHVSGILTVAHALYDGACTSGEVFNMGADNEQPNIDIVHRLIELTNSSKDLIQHVKDRPGHDRRYAMGYQKMEQRFGWKPSHNWDDGLAQTVEWYRTNDSWIKSVHTGEYRKWIDEHYT